MQKSIIAAVRNDKELDMAINANVWVIFDLCPNLITLPQKAETVHNAGKKLYIHMDLAEGIGKDRCGIDFVRRCKVDGIISTRSNIIKLAREAGLTTVQRFFIVDSKSVDTTVETVKTSKPDMIEIMPGIVTKVVASLKATLDMPVICGGLIDDAKEIDTVLSAGATAISTGKTELWNR